MITTHQIQLVKQTWTSLRRVNPELLGDVFHSRLFLENPSLRPMFIQPMRAQYNKLVDMLNVAVARIDRPDELVVTLRHLGVHHQRIEVRPKHYAVVGNALLWTVRNGLGRDWNEDVAVAWQAFYQWLAEVMIQAAKLE